MLGYGVASHTVCDTVAKTYFWNDRTGWSLVYSDPSSFTSHVQVVTYREEDYEFEYVCVCVLAFRSEAVLSLSRKLNRYMALVDNQVIIKTLTPTCTVNGHRDRAHPPVAVRWTVLYTICMMGSEVPAVSQSHISNRVHCICSNDVCETALTCLHRAVQGPSRRFFLKTQMAGCLCSVSLSHNTVYIGQRHCLAVL